MSTDYAKYPRKCDYGVGTVLFYDRSCYFLHAAERAGSRVREDQSLHHAVVQNRRYAVGSLV